FINNNTKKDNNSNTFINNNTKKDNNSNTFINNSNDVDINSSDTTTDAKNETLFDIDVLIDRYNPKITDINDTDKGIKNFNLINTSDKNLDNLKNEYIIDKNNENNTINMINNRNTSKININNFEIDNNTSKIPFTPAQLISTTHCKNTINLLNFIHGLKRFEARLKTLHILKKLNLYIKDIGCTQNLPICSRSKDIIEPVVKKQWFMDCSNLAKKSIKAVETGELEIYPVEARKTWNNWLVNIREWCLSRQLWYGHRIPAYRVFVDGKRVDWVVGNTKNSVIVSAIRKLDSLSKDTSFDLGVIKTSNYGSISKSISNNISDNNIDNTSDINTRKNVSNNNNNTNNNTNDTSDINDIKKFNLTNTRKTVIKEDDNDMNTYSNTNSDSNNTSIYSYSTNETLSNTSLMLDDTIIEETTTQRQRKISIIAKDTSSYRISTTIYYKEIYPNTAENDLVPLIEFKYKSKVIKLVQDEDVLDTWFSSGLWPFAILGWNGEDLISKSKFDLKNSNRNVNDITEITDINESIKKFNLINTCNNTSNTSKDNSTSNINNSNNTDNSNNTNNSNTNKVDSTSNINSNNTRNTSNSNIDSINTDTNSYTTDFSKYFPVSVLETGYDILFFWVARMTMLSIELTQTIPFKKILLHGIIRDAHGKKMSKSLGNVIDPLFIINGIKLSEMNNILKESHNNGYISNQELLRALDSQKKDFPRGVANCGADALRFALCSYVSGMKDVNLDIQRVEGYRRLCNKIWNAFKFVSSLCNNTGSNTTSKSFTCIDTNKNLKSNIDCGSNCKSNFDNYINNHISKFNIGNNNNDDEYTIYNHNHNNNNNESTIYNNNNDEYTIYNHNNNNNNNNNNESTIYNNNNNNNNESTIYNNNNNNKSNIYNNNSKFNINENIQSHNIDKEINHKSNVDNKTTFSNNTTSSITTDNITSNDIEKELLSIDSIAEDLNKLQNTAPFLHNLWILKKRNECIANYTLGMQTYNFMLATQSIHKFFLTEFCDFYIEIVKKTKSDLDIKILDFVFKDILRLFSPFMPFISEEIYQRVRTICDSVSITIDNFPSHICEKKIINSLSFNNINTSSNTNIINIDNTNNITTSFENILMIVKSIRSIIDTNKIKSFSIQLLNYNNTLTFYLHNMLKNLKNIQIVDKLSASYVDNINNIKFGLVDEDSQILDNIDRFDSDDNEDNRF
ncbi:hypothetical protein EDEG_01214, partial [Edhazardia aedis USNM 41457]